MRALNTIGDALLRAAESAIAAVDPEPAVRRWIGAHPGPAAGESVSIIAFGKASPAMARGAYGAIRGPIASVLVASDHVEGVPPGSELIVAGHPVPNDRSLQAGRRALDIAAEAKRVLFLVSGGGSALLELPIDDVTLADVAAVTQALLASGAPIGDVNTVRTHLSQVKGGRLGAVAPAGHITLALSDVIGSPPAAIASGPTVAAQTRCEDALAVIERWRIGHKTPQSVLDALRRADTSPAVPAPGAYVVLGDGRMAAAAACAALQRSGVTAQIIDTELAGAVGDAASDAYRRVAPGTVGVFAGETTVTVTGGGRGGRNQQAALTLATHLLESDDVALCIGTDGIDGPTDAAGAVVDGTSADTLRHGGVDPQAALADNDAYPALDAVDALVRTGPTGTNVGDLWLIWRA